MDFTILTDEEEKELYRLSRFYWQEALRCEKTRLAGCVMLGSLSQGVGDRGPNGRYRPFGGGTQADECGPVVIKARGRVRPLGFAPPQWIINDEANPRLQESAGGFAQSHLLLKRPLRFSLPRRSESAK